MHGILRAVPLAFALTLLAPGCALMEPPGLNQTRTVAAGSTFVRSTTDSGSYGSGTSTATFTRMPTRMWKGEEVGVWANDRGPTLLFALDNGAFHAFVDGDTPVITYDPPATYDYPLKVGKSWTRSWKMTVHRTNQTVPIEMRTAVEAYEDVSVPAGTFKAFRIRTQDNLGNEDVNWFSTEMGVFIKQKLTRTARHAAGPGVRETELLSQTFRRQ